MSTKLYVVTKGCYSDFHLCGIYSTCEKAERAKELFCADNDIEEWDLDGIPEAPPGMLPWHVRMDIDGKVNEVSRTGAAYFEPRWSDRAWPSYVWMSFYVWARDEQHAVKIANERRVGLILSGELKP